VADDSLCSIARMRSCNRWHVRIPAARPAVPSATAVNTAEMKAPSAAIVGESHPKQNLQTGSVARDTEQPYLQIEDVCHRFRDDNR
jgi:hypothetical protein